MPDNNATAEYFQDQADSAQTPWMKAHYRRCASQYRAQSSERELSETTQHLMEAAAALMAGGHRNEAEEYLLTIRQEIIPRLRRLIERKRSLGLDTSTAEGLLRTVQGWVAKLDHTLAKLA